MVTSADVELRDLPVAGASLSDDACAEDFVRRDGPLPPRLREMLAQLKAQPIWQLDQEDLWTGRLDAFTTPERKFDDVVVLNAECFPRNIK